MEENNNTNKKNMSIKSFIKDWVIPIISALIIALLINKFLFFNVVVPTGSMIPTINKEDKGVISVIYNTENMKRGDIIVFHSNEYDELLIKRLIGLPGDDIEIKNGIVSVNGEELKEDYVKNKDDYNGTFKVPEGKYFFLGDNRPNSADSRYWDDPYVSSSDIKGKLQFRFYPLKDFGIVK